MARERCVLVTGASGGIGAAIASAFAKQGDRVVLGSMSHPDNARALCHTLRQKGYEAFVVQADVTSEEQVDGMFREIEKQYGAVEVLVNNAGIARQKLFCELSAAEWDGMFGVHVRGAFLCCRRALPQMIQRKAGCIVNIASMWGQVGAACESDYSAAKAALIGLTKALAKEEGPSGIRVNCVAPGVVDTAMMQDFSAADRRALCEEIPLRRFGTAREVAAAVAFLASDQAAYITGQVLGVNGGMVM